MKTFPNMRLAACLLATILLGPVFAAEAGIAVIGNPADGTGQLSKQQVKRIFLGKIASLPNGSVAEVVDLPPDDPARKAFYSQVIHKTPAQLKSYWAKRVFTGKGAPPKTLPDAAAVKQWVRDGKGRIGYIDSGDVDDSVQVLFTSP